MEKSSSSAISNMNTEFLIDTILSRLDGPSLAATACACSDLKAAASDQNLWKNLCTSTWPSIANSAVVETLDRSKGFCELYADAFPLIMCQPDNTVKPFFDQATSSDLASFVDIYYKGKCILSKALDVIPDCIGANDDEVANKDENEMSEELRQWLLDCPFRLDLLPPYDDTDITLVDEHDNLNFPRSNVSDDCITYLESLTSSKEKGKRGIDLRDELTEDIRLSWILFDKKNGKAVNLSSWKPMLVQKSWAPEGEYVFHFGSIVPGEGLADKFAECKIVARCQVNNSGYAKWSEISMRVENMAGAHFNTSKSLAVLNQALISKRTARHVEVERANQEYKIYKNETKRRNDRHEYLVNKLYTLAGMTVLTTISYGCATLFL